MKLTLIIALVLVALDCAAKASGSQPQTIFSQDNLWVWWIPTAGWLLNAAIMCFAKVEL